VIGEAEDLNQVERFSPVQARCLPELLKSRLFADLVNLAGDEKLVSQIRLIDNPAECSVVRRVSRPGVYDGAAVADKCSQHLGNGHGASFRNLRHWLARAKPDDWERLTCPWNHARWHTLLSDRLSRTQAGNTHSGQ
jgi:hypothetical protein